MGTDIHFYVERREPGGAWTWADETKDDGYGGREVVDPYFEGHSYSTFAILADVRNGTGFAGVRTGAGFEPIAAPRGLPDDLSTELRRVLFEGGGGYHTPSWLTLAEVMAYDWCRSSTYAGYLDLKTWARLRHWRRDPEQWCGEVGGGGVRKLTTRDVAERLLGQDLGALARGEEHAVRDAVVRCGGGSVYVAEEWPVRYTEAASDFLAHTVPRLWRLGAPTDVRCVFNFDS